MPRSLLLTRNPQFLVLTVLTSVGAWLRLWHLGAQSLWLDEGATAALARASWQHFAWVWWHGEASLQTIYFLLMRGWVHGGFSESWLRLPSALFGIAAIPLLFVVARKFVGVPAALGAAALLTFSPAHVYFSQEARSYTLGIVLVLLTTLFFVRAVEDDHSRDWALWTICGIAAFYTHYFTALVLVAQVTSLFFRRGAVPWQRTLVWGAVILLAATPGLSYVYRASPENLYFAWMPRADAKEIRHLAMFFGGGGVKVAFAGGLWIAGIVAIFRNRRSGDSDSIGRGMLIVLWAILPPAILAAISLREPMFLQRYMVFSLPGTILLAAAGAEFLQRWKIGTPLIILLCLLSVPAIVKQYDKPREDWRGATNTVLSSATPGDAVVFFPFYSRIMLDYYQDLYGTAAPQLHVFAPGYYSGGEDDRNLLATLNHDPQQFRHVWVFIAGRDGMLEDFDGGAALQNRLQAVYGEPAVRRFAGVQVLRFGQ